MISQTLLAGASIGLSLAIVALTLGDKRLTRQVAGLIVATVVGGAAHSVLVGQLAMPVSDAVELVLRMAAVTGLACFWQFVNVVFGDRQRSGELAAVLVILWCGAVLVEFPGVLPFSGGALIRSAGTLIVGHATWTLLWGRRQDLDEHRRLLRVWWAGAAIVYVAAMLFAAELDIKDWLGSGNLILAEVAQVLIKIGFIWSVARHPEQWPWLPRYAYLSGDPVASKAAVAGPERAEGDLPPALSTRESHVLDDHAGRILAAVQTEGLFRRPGLTLKDLSDHLRLPEHRVRAAINQHLGHRNFNAFLNHFRLAEVAQQLRSAEHAHLPVLTLALTAGFGSIGPFNRAFKDAFGVTPTQYRNQSMGPGLADSLNS